MPCATNNNRILSTAAGTKSQLQAWRAATPPSRQARSTESTRMQLMHVGARAFPAHRAAFSLPTFVISAAFWKNEATRSLTMNTPALSSFNGASFDCVFYVGGFGTMWDFPQSADVARVAGEACVAPSACPCPVQLARDLHPGTPPAKSSAACATAPFSWRMSRRPTVPMWCVCMCCQSPL